MNIFKKVAGKILYFIAQIVSGILEGLITLIEFIVSFVLSIARGIIGILSMGGCLLLFILGPFGIALLFHPLTFLMILFFVVFPILGTKFISYLKYLKYIITEYLFDRANYLIEGKEGGFKSFNEYGNRYRRMEEERWREEQQRRQAEQQREWEERFRQWSEYQNSQRGNSGYGGYWKYGGNTGYNNGQSYVNPSIEFKRKYEKSCDMLGIDYGSDKYEIKLAYRKKAKNLIQI